MGTYVHLCHFSGSSPLMKSHRTTLFITVLAVATSSVLIFKYCEALFTDRDGRSERQLTLSKMNRLLSFAERYWLESQDGIATVCMNRQEVFIPNSYSRNGRFDSWGSRLVVYCTDSKVCVRSSGKNRKDENQKGDDLVVCKSIYEFGDSVQ